MDPLTLTTMAQLLGPIASTLMQRDEPIKNPHLFRKSFRLGGAVMDPREAELPQQRIEVEDEEVIQPPQGQAVEVRGNTHEEGGIPLDLEGGTVVYSSSLKGTDGKTMAERKKRRDQLLAKLSKELKDSKADSVHRATIERAMETTLLEDMSDVVTMQQAYMEEQGATEEMPKAQTGMLVGANPGSSGFEGNAPRHRVIKEGFSWDHEFPPYYFQRAYFEDEAEWDNIVASRTDEAMNTPKGQELIGILSSMWKDDFGNIADKTFQPSPKIATGGARSLPNTPLAQETSMVADAMLGGGDPVSGGFEIPQSLLDLQSRTVGNAKVNMPETTDTAAANFSAGDIASIAGPIGKTMTTLFNRLGDRPTPNYNQNVGAEQEALQMQGMRGTAEARDLEMQRNNRMLTALRFKNQARGASTQRAMDLGALTSAGETQGRISGRFQQLLNQQLQQRGQTATQRDRLLAEGRKFADITDTQNRDNFATQIGTNIGDVSRGVQHMEKNKLRRELGAKFQGNEGEDALNSLMQLLYR